MSRNEYLLNIAERVFPELAAGKFFAITGGAEYYFSGLQHTEVEQLYRSFYDEFDFAFCIRCSFSLCDLKTDTRWVRQEGEKHFYTTPVLRVVERTDFNYAPANAIRRMRTHYRANTLVLETYSRPGISSGQLAEGMNAAGLYFFLKEELHTIAAPGIMHFC